ncbi:MAG: hypothetical protein WA982_16540 [Rubrobacteraceae bacterium]
MKRKRQRTKSVDALIGEMGRERIALRAKKTTIVLLLVSSMLCLFSAFASLMGVIPYAIGPSVVLILAAVVGLVLAAVESRSP